MLKKLLLTGVATLFVTAALAQTTILDQVPSPAPSQPGVAEQITQSISVPGGLLYVTTVAQQKYAPGNGQPQGVASVFVPSSQGGYLRYLSLTSAKSDVGVVFTTSAGAGVFGVTRSAGSTLYLVGETTSSNAKTDKAIWETTVASSYVAGQAIPITLNANYTGGGTPTAATTTLTVAAYTEVNGVETAIAGITAAQQFTGTATNYIFNIPGNAGLVVGSHIVVEVVMLVTNAAGSNTGQINSVAMTM